jgi:L-arabinokinase
MAIEQGADRVSASRKNLVFAYYVTGHGFGHATRVVEVVRHLILAGHDVHVVTGAPDFVFTTEIQSSRLFLRKVCLLISSCRKNLSSCLLYEASQCLFGET